jgi:hypothetical protein
VVDSIELNFLDICMRPIADKYREGKMKTTLKGGFKGGERVLSEGDLLTHPS